MISPYVRRLRLGAELRALRVERGLTHAELAAMIGQSRAQISRLENGYAVNQDVVLKILDSLEIAGDRWVQLVNIAREGGERGWWESNAALGARQALYADLEAGAATIREYQLGFIPGLLQTREYIRARIEVESEGRVNSRLADKAVDARNRRQRMLRRPGGPSYEVIIDELAVHRRAVPTEVVGAQLYHVAARVHSDPGTRVYVLPMKVAIEGYYVPRSAFSIYTYRDSGDPTVVVVDTVTEDLVLTDLEAVKLYDDLYHRLRNAALPLADSLRLLIDTANDTLQVDPDPAEDPGGTPSGR